MRLALRVLVALVLLVLAQRANAADASAGVCAPDAPCNDAGASDAARSSATSVPRATREDSDAGAVRMVFFFGDGCPHCADAEPAVSALERRHPKLVVERVNVRSSETARDELLAQCRRLGIEPPGIPLFVIGDDWVLGFDEAKKNRLEEIVSASERGDRPAEPGPIELPLVGSFDPASVSLPAFTIVIGVLDGLNPCAFYVLVVLLGVLMHVRSRARLVLYGGVFVVMSGLVYFAFMTAWLNVFLLVGVASWLTRLLGVVLVGMGLVNLKELVFFKKGASLMIPASAKPGLFRRMRSVATAATLPVAVAGITGLAFIVNLVELGCTVGLPAIYTRVLSMRPGVGAWARYGYLALYNLAYVVPLALIVAAYGLIWRRLSFTKRRAQLLKALSGALLVTFGAAFLLWPGMLSR